MFQFPHPAREFAKAAHDLNVPLWYDIAHVAGLIAGGKFHKQPFKDGVDFMTMSIHKTFPGPQGGAIVANVKDAQGEERWKALQKAVFPGTVSSHHIYRIPPLVITCLEFKEFGKAYAEQIVKNSQALGRHLSDLGFNVLFKSKGFTESHQIAVDVSKEGGGRLVGQKLEEANIILNKNLLPYDEPNKAVNPSGIRIGSQEMTKFGMKEAEMKRVAELINAVVHENRPPESVRSEVVEFRREFQEQGYCFPESDLKELLEGAEPLAV